MSSTLTSQSTPSRNAKATRVRDYWDAHVHDATRSAAPSGTATWYQDLETYRYTKLSYLPRAVPFEAFTGQRVLDVGCGVGFDLARFARGGAHVTGIDLSPRTVDLAARFITRQGLQADVRVMDGEAMTFPDASFDVVYAHGVIHYAADPVQMVREIHRVLRPGGTAILMLFHARSWLMAFSRIGNVELDHRHAPAFRTYTRAEARTLLRGFNAVRIVPERFPVRTVIHEGWKASLYNGMFVPMFNALPRALTRRWGWHLMVWAEK